MRDHGGWVFRAESAGALDAPVAARRHLNKRRATQRNRPLVAPNLVYGEIIALVRDDLDDEVRLALVRHRGLRDLVG